MSTATTSPIHAAMLTESERLNLPTHYRCDLETDRQYLDGKWGEPAKEFLWYLYDCGTHIVPLVYPTWNGPYVTGNRPIDITKAICNSFGHDGHWYYWTGKSLNPITEQRALDIAGSIRPPR